MTSEQEETESDEFDKLYSLTLLSTMKNKLAYHRQIGYRNKYFKIARNSKNPPPYYGVHAIADLKETEIEISNLIKKYQDITFEKLQQQDPQAFKRLKQQIIIHRETRFFS